MGYIIKTADMADPAQRREISRLAAKVYGADEGELEEEFAERVPEFAEGRARCFFCEADGVNVAFAEVTVRTDYVNGTDGSPVGFLEGIYVEEAHRSRGAARMLVGAAERFSRQAGCSQLASDCLLENTASERFHRRCGFRETERVIYFVKDI